jgi:hypothetical protein
LIKLDVTDSANIFVWFSEKGQRMRYLISFVLIFTCVEAANALTPLPDGSSGFFSGEWAGTGAQGMYCFLNMNTDGHGLVMIDNGSGDWLGARITWRNRQQSLEIEKIIPLPMSSQLRIMPLERFTINTEFNQTLKLNWSNHSDACYLQKTGTAANHLNRARKLIDKLQPSKSTQ